MLAIYASVSMDVSEAATRLPAEDMVKRVEDANEMLKAKTKDHLVDPEGIFPDSVHARTRVLLGS